MEILAILMVLLLAWFFIKFLSVFFHAGIFIFSIPFLLIGFAVSAVVIVALLVPLGIVTALLSVILIPLGFIIPLLPFILVGFGVWILLKKN